jgi:5-methylcytosine-specific restriction protein A
MQLSSITRESVLSAIAECDALGREDFLSVNGFAEAREYFLIHAGKAYDSKAIAGVAYRLATGTEVRSADFTGGRYVASALTELGFHVTGDADWQWDELVLACDVLHVVGWQHTVRSHDHQAIELSQFLRAQDPSLALSPNFRSPESVQRKLEDLRTVHPRYIGKPTRGGRATRQVVEAFLTEPERMHNLAQLLAAQGSLARTDDDGDDPGSAQAVGSSPREYVSAAEGRIRERLVKVRERNPKLRRAKIELSRRVNGNIACEACSFDFERAYGGRGNDFIHVHHVVPLHFSGEVESKLDDLILLCANCHVVVHRRSPWLTPDELRGLVEGRTLTKDVAFAAESPVSYEAAVRQEAP